MRFFFFTVTLLLFSSSISAQTQVERDFNTFVLWLSGSWDNEIQTFNEDFSGVPEDQRHDRIHMVYRAIKAEAFPGFLFVIENIKSELRKAIFLFIPYTNL